MVNKRGSKEELGRIKFPSLNLEIVVEDDGCNDPDVRVYCEGKDLHRDSVPYALVKVRDRVGDGEFIRALERPNEDRTDLTKYRSGIFVCEQCELSNPRKWEAEDGICKSCSDSS